MTDDERMDRARRIRQMREGSRVDESDDDEGVDDGEAPAVADAPADEAPSDAGDAAPDPTAGPSGTRAALPSAEQLETAVGEAGTAAVAAVDEGASEDVEAPAVAEAPGVGDTDGPERVDIAGVATGREDATRVLEFSLGDEQYCLDIEYIEEIVKEETVTRVPNTPDFVAGVVDLRGQITTILDPKVAIGREDEETGELIVVFDGESFDEGGSIGWLVDDVRRVSPITDDQVNESPSEDEHVNGVIDREDDDQFVIWTTPELAIGEAD